MSLSQKPPSKRQRFPYPDDAQSLAARRLARLEAKSFFDSPAKKPPMDPFHIEYLGASVSLLAYQELQSIHEEALTDCPECAAKKSLKKLISAPAIRFEGEGWTPKFHK